MLLRTMRRLECNDGLDPQLQYEVRSFELTTYSAVVNKAKLLEQGHKLLKEDSESSKKRNWEGNSHFGGQNSMSNKKQSTMQFHNRNQQSESVKCWRCKGKHHPRDCQWLSGACLNCGKIGHKAAMCSSVRSLVGTCFNCGQQGHKAISCPQPRQNTPIIQNTYPAATGHVATIRLSKIRNQKPKTQDRVYTLTQKDTQTSNTMVTGTIPISSIFFITLYSILMLHIHLCLFSLY